MKTRVALIVLAMTLLPVATSQAGHRDRGERYDRSSRHYYDDGGRHHGRGHHDKSRSYFDFSIGFSSGGYYDGGYSSFRYGYSNWPAYRDRVVVVEPAPVYVPPPVIYAPPPRVYYYEPVYAPRYYYRSSYYYCR